MISPYLPTPSVLHPYDLLFNPYGSRLTSHSIADICYSQGFFNTQMLLLEILETDAFLKKFG